MTDEDRKQFQFYIAALKKHKDCLNPMIVDF